MMLIGCAHLQTKNTEVRSISFGLFDDDDHLFSTTRIPYVIGIHYGWALNVRSTKEKVRVKEIFKLPAMAPWIKDDLSISDSVKVICDWHSQSGNIRISEFNVKMKPNSNAADGTDIIMPYRIVHGDPKGTHEISVFVEGKLVKKYEFQILTPEWAIDERNIQTNSGNAYRWSNSKLTKYELLDTQGNSIPPKPDADFPEIISTNLYPHFLAASFIGFFETASNKETSRITTLQYDDLYSITNEGDYMLIVQPVLYKRRSSDGNLLDRIDSPCITTKVHLVPNIK